MNLQWRLAVDDDDIVRVFSKKPALGMTRPKMSQPVKIYCMDASKVSCFSEMST